MDKRRIVDLLPDVFRTETNKKFFASTVDQLFQPGTSQQVSGYIGEKPSYFDASKDFYVPEPNATRTAYQLTPAMVSRDAAGETTHMVFHDDFINYMKDNNALIGDQNRLLADRSFAWMPPIDLDKLINFQQYYWFGDNPERIPVLTLKVGSAIYTATGSQTEFALPPREGGISEDRETPLVYVDARPVEAVRVGENMRPVHVPGAGAAVEVFRYGDLRRAIEGLENFDISGLLVEEVPVTTLTSNMRITLSDGFSRYAGWDLLPFETIFLAAPFLCKTTEQVPWDVSTLREFNSFMVEGVGSKLGIELVGVPSETSDVTDKLHVVIDRRSRDRNPWSRANYWVHRDSFAWSGISVPDRRARRPIIEFNANIELHNYGTRRLRDITAVLTGNPILLAGDPGTDLYDNPINPRDVPGWREIDLTDVGGKIAGRVFVDNGHRLKAGDRFLIRQNANPDLVNRIIEVATSTQTIVENGVTKTVEVLILNLTDAAQPGDIVRKIVAGWSPYEEDPQDTAPWDFKETPIEYVFDGEGWEVAQAADPHKDPLFKLYTDTRTAHADLPRSDFKGNRLFGFAVGSGTSDAILKRPLRYAAASSASAEAEIVFEHDQVTRVTRQNDQPVPGYAYYRVLGETRAQDRYENGWYATADVSRQRLGSDGVFEVPAGLLSNPDFEEVGFTDRSQYFEHVTTLLRRQDAFEGSAFQRNNWRDTARDPAAGFVAEQDWGAFRSYFVGDTVKHSIHHYRCTSEHISGATFDASKWFRRPALPIVQPRSSALKAMLLTADRRFDYLDAARYVDGEYQRFRNKVSRQIEEFNRTGRLKESDADETWVETILNTLRVAKTPEFPFALSAMAGGTYYIPPTAASMGMLPVAKPGFEIDTTYATPVMMLRGHDGSRTPVEPGLRARIMLAMEMRIWRNIAASFKSEQKPYFDFDDVIASRANGGGKGRETTRGNETPCDDEPTPYESDNPFYLPEEVAQILTPVFITWAQINGLNFRIHDDFDPSNPFTWNYRDVPDRDGRPCPGNWRAIYRWFFDTDRPHAAPWQMLGFLSQPEWWEEEYGAAPYTRGNLPLWEDIRDGRIRRGPRAGVDARYARPDFLDILPIDENGGLLDPLAAGIVAVRPTPEQAPRLWTIGDHGPVENLWINSASYPFARAMLGYLIRPYEWTEITWNTRDHTVLPNGQWLNTSTLNRPRAAGLAIHGELIDEKSQHVITGMQQWIVDRMTSRAQKPGLLGDAVRGLGCRLAHKMAGYTRADNLRVFADNFGILPAEDVEVTLHPSAPLRMAVYSGIIVEWTGNGWSLVGYDTTKDGFCIKRGDETSATQTISLGDDPPVYEWRGNRTYPMNTLVEHRGTVYRAVRSHTSSLIFEEEYWSPTSVKNSRLPKVKVYTRTDGFYTFVPYGTVFTTIQEVAEFLWDWGRTQEEDGFVFDGIDPVTGEIQNWELAVRQFLDWTQADWQPGNFIALSPGASQLKFVTPHGYVYNVEDTINGIYGLIDRTGRPIARKNTFVSRIDEETKILTTTDNLFCARLHIGEIEHVVSFSNVTLFNDVVYRPLFSLRQPRLRVLGLRTREWKGRLDAPGYIVNGDELLPNFDRAAENIRTMFEIEGSEDRTLRDYARHVIGYQPRPYLDNLLISETQQFEFYQGMIQTKGAPSVFSRLTRSRIVDDHTDLAFLEEWGFQIGRYGATDVRETISFRLDQADIRGIPQFVTFGPDDPYDAILSLPKGSERWIRPPRLPEHFFPETGAPEALKGLGSPKTNRLVPALPSAGPVRIEEITVTAFNTDYLAQLWEQSRIDNPIFEGWTLWLYDQRTPERGWDVLRAYGVGSGTCAIIGLVTTFEDATLLPGVTRVTFNEPHGLTARDHGLQFVIADTTGTDPDLEGFHRIVSVENERSILIDSPLGEGVDLSGSPRVTSSTRSIRWSRVSSATWMTSTQGSIEQIRGSDRVIRTPKHIDHAFVPILKGGG